MLAKRKLREIALQMLYSGYGDKEAGDFIVWMMKEHKMTKKNILLAYTLAREAYEYQKVSDLLIQKNSIDYAFDRIPKVELNVLRLCIFEMLERTLPLEVAIAEGVRLAKKYATPESGKYVHAILNSIGVEKGLVGRPEEGEETKRCKKKEKPLSKQGAAKERKK